MSYGQPATQYIPGVPHQTQPVLQATTTSHQPQPNGKARQIPGVRYFAVITGIIAFLLCILGIVAIIIEAKNSYVGDPIWTGVLFILPTGILGLVSYWKRNNMCSNVSYLIMNIFACVMSAHLVIYASIMAVLEHLPWWYGNHCDPTPGWDYYNYDYDDNCQFAPSGRIAVDSLIAVLAFIQLVLSIISLAFTCYGTFTCCYNCCRPAPPPAVVQYTAQNGTCQLVSVGAYQTPTAYQPVSLMVPAGQHGQVVSPNYAVVQGQIQPQPYPVPAAPTQVTFVQQPQPMNATPGFFVNPPAPSAAPVAPTAPTANGATVADSAETKPEMPPETSVPQQEPPNISYGQTASEQFHDERNLLETV